MPVKPGRGCPGRAEKVDVVAEALPHAKRTIRLHDGNHRVSRRHLLHAGSGYPRPNQRTGDRARRFYLHGHGRKLCRRPERLRSLGNINLRSN